MPEDIRETWKSRWFQAVRGLRSAVNLTAPPVVLFTEGADPRVQQAASFLTQNGIARVQLLGHNLPSSLASDALTLIDPNRIDGLDAAAAALFEKRKHKGMLEGEARALFRSPLYIGAHILAADGADVAVSGACHTTADVIRAGVQVIGKDEPEGTVSSCFVMLTPNGRAITFADCGVVPKPSSAQLADIAIASAESHRRLMGEPPLVAFLSFSTLGSATHESIDIIKEAIALTKKRRPELEVDGELQFDAAFVPEVAARKAPNSRVAGRANVFVFPDLAAGNIGYKICERVGGAIAIGPLLQGLAKPWMDLSRGCSVEDITLVASLGCLARKPRKPLKSR
ncbi:MAG: phosphate acetyltransferase [Oligoflexia bacterium]|nr:phosphate acetyltransferase [Oligoflexia bacterium]